MNSQFLLVISIFTGIAGIALLVQMCVFIAMFLTMRTVQKRAMQLMDRVDPLIDTTRHILEETRQQARGIFGKLNDITEATRVQVLRIDEMLAEISAHTRTNLDRIDALAAATVQRVDETVAQLQRVILAPVRGINGAAAAVRAMVGHLVKRRASVNGRATQEEDLFI
jgi:uncharacterized protein YoxC